AQHEQSQLLKNHKSTQNPPPSSEVDVSSPNPSPSPIKTSYMQLLQMLKLKSVLVSCALLISCRAPYGVCEILNLKVRWDGIRRGGAVARGIGSREVFHSANATIGVPLGHPLLDRMW